MKKASIAMLLFLCFALLFTACGRETGAQATTTTAQQSTQPTTATTTQEHTTVPEPSQTETTAPTTAESTTATPSTTKPTTTKPVTTKPTTTKPSTTKPATTKPATTKPTTTKPTTTKPSGITQPKTNAEIVKLYNDSTRKVNKDKPAFQKTVNTAINNIQGDKIDSLLGMSVPGVGSIRSLVGSFLGEGTQNYTADKGKASDHILPSNLTASDLNSASCKVDGNNYILTLQVKSAANAQMGNSSTIGKFTQDFQTGAAAKKEIENINMAGISASLKSIQTNHTNIKIVATINKNTGRFVSLSHSFRFDVTMTELKVKILLSTITVNSAYGEGNTTVRYSGFQY